MRPLANLLFVPLLVLGACAAGNQHRYDDLVAAVPYSGSGQLAVAARDQRPYVLAGEKGPQFTGVSRGGFGNPFNITTASGKPLAEDLTAVLVRSLQAKGFAPLPVAIAAGDEQTLVEEKLRATGAPRAVLLLLREWKSDTYTNTALHYDLVLQVLDGAGAPLAEAKLQGKDDLGGSMWNPPKHARSAVPPACRQKLEQLLADPGVVAALR